MNDTDIIKSKILQHITLTCFPSPFRMLSITLSRYISTISGAIIFIYQPTSGVLYKMFPISFPKYIKIPATAIEKYNVILNILLIFLRITDLSSCTLNLENSGTSKELYEYTITLGNIIIGIAIPQMMPYSAIAFV